MYNLYVIFIYNIVTKLINGVTYCGLQEKAGKKLTDFVAALESNEELKVHQFIIFFLTNIVFCHGHSY